MTFDIVKLCVSADASEVDVCLAADYKFFDADYADLTQIYADYLLPADDCIDIKDEA